MKISNVVIISPQMIVKCFIKYGITKFELINGVMIHMWKHPKPHINPSTFSIYFYTFLWMSQISNALGLILSQNNIILFQNYIHKHEWRPYIWRGAIHFGLHGPVKRDHLSQRLYQIWFRSSQVLIHKEVGDTQQSNTGISTQNCTVGAIKIY